MHIDAQLEHSATLLFHRQCQSATHLALTLNILLLAAPCFSVHRFSQKKWESSSEIVTLTLSFRLVHRRNEQMLYRHAASNSQNASEDPFNGLPLVADTTGEGRDVRPATADEAPESRPTDKPMEGWEVVVAADMMASCEKASDVSMTRLVLLMC